MILLAARRPAVLVHDGLDGSVTEAPGTVTVHGQGPVTASVGSSGQTSAAKRTRSRSVRMPTARRVLSTTTTDPTPASRMRAEASATVSDGAAVTAGVVVVRSRQHERACALPNHC